MPWDYTEFLPAFHFINKHAWEQNPQALFIGIKLIHQQIAILLQNWNLALSVAVSVQTASSDFYFFVVLFLTNTIFYYSFQ